MRAARTRVIAAAVTAAVAGALTIGSAGVAYAEPQGCVGVPSIPEAFVCVVSVTPTNAVPTIGGTGGTQVTVPSVCYFLACTDPTTVTVPTPTLSGGTGSVAVVYYNGSTYTVASPFDYAGVATLVEQLVAAVSALPGQVVTLVTPIVDAVVAQLGPVGTSIGETFLMLGSQLCQTAHGTESANRPRTCYIPGGSIYDVTWDQDYAISTAAGVLYALAWVFHVA